MENQSFLKWETKFEDILIKHNGIKRIFDIVFSSIVLVIGSPVFMLIAILVYFSSPGPIFYGHIRIGRGYKKIRCWKFRTMVLKKDLVFTTDNGKTMITQDNIDNTYDRVGGPYSNYKP